MQKGKRVFTKEEFDTISRLVGGLPAATPNEAKKIRNRLRSIGLYWSEVAPGLPYNSDMLAAILAKGIITVKEEPEAEQALAKKAAKTPIKTQPKAKKEEPETAAQSPKSRPKVFISYKRRDRYRVFPLKTRIEEAIRQPAWIDLDGIESDAQFVEVIIRAIKDCEVFLFMYSGLHNKISDFTKDWTIRELQYAEQQNKKIVFLNLDGSELGDWFSFMFGQKQQIDARSNEAITRLLADLKLWLEIDETATLPPEETPTPDADETPEPKGEPEAEEKPEPDSKPDKKPEAEEKAQPHYEAEAHAIFLKGYLAEQKRQFEKAVGFYRQAIKQNSPEALFRLGVLHHEEHTGVLASSTKALEYLRKAADMGYEEAIKYLEEKSNEFSTEPTIFKLFVGNSPSHHDAILVTAYIRNPLSFTYKATLSVFQNKTIIISKDVTLFKVERNEYSLYQRALSKNDFTKVLAGKSGTYNFKLQLQLEGSTETVSQNFRIEYKSKWLARDVFKVIRQ